MRIFLADATGVIGRRVLTLLVAGGYHVTALTRREQEAAWLHANGAEAVVGDVYDAAALAEVVRTAAPEVVVHQLTELSGGKADPNAAVRRAGTRNLVDAALAAGVRQLVAQSIAFAYEPGPGPATEATPLDLDADPPRSTSVRGVAALEDAVREPPEWVILRYGLLYGPGTWYAPDGSMAAKARTGDLVADADVTSFVHADDAALAAVQALEWPSGVVNICDDEPATGHEWVPAFCQAVGAPAPSTSPSRHDWARGADNHYARKHLDWEPRYPTWRDGFEAMVHDQEEGDPRA